jgi:hypothetical protein
MRVSARVFIPLTFVFSLAGGTRLHAQDSVKVERPSAELITREQIEGVKSTNLLEVIEALHNNWLRERMPTPRDRATTRLDTTGKSQQYIADNNGTGRSMPGENGGIQVYLDGTRVGGLAELKNIRPGDVYSVRRINGIDAQARFGIGHGAGVLFISSVTMRSKSPN